MSTRQRENRKNGNQESSSKEASEEGSQENCKKEVSRQRNRQHNRGTPKASPDVFLGNARSPVFMRLRPSLSSGISKLAFGAVAGCDALLSPRPRVIAGRRERTSGDWRYLPLERKRCEADPDFLHEAPNGFACAALRKASRMRFAHADKLTGHPGGRTSRRICLPKWYQAMTPFEEAVAHDAETLDCR
jgi:hypothetical protein